MILKNGKIVTTEYKNFIKIIIQIYIKYKKDRIERLKTKFQQDIDSQRKKLKEQPYSLDKNNLLETEIKKNTTELTKTIEHDNNRIKDVTANSMINFLKNTELINSFKNPGVFIMDFDNIDEENVPYNYYPYSSEQDTEISQAGVDYDIASDAHNTDYAAVNVVAESPYSSSE
jgi:hypothetical protein